MGILRISEKKSKKYSDAIRLTSVSYTHLDLRINSILIRRGRMSYHVLSEEETPGKFNAKHIQLQNIIANISLKALSKDSLKLGRCV